MFDKTLDAAIGRSDLKRNFEGIDDQLESAADAIKKSGTPGKDERKILSSVVNEQIGLVRERVQETRESAEQWVESQMHDHIIDNIARVLDVIDGSKHPLTLEKIAELALMDKMLVSRLLSVLSEGNQIKVERDPKTNIQLFSRKILF
ncbi:hypothetical protein KA005_74685 [bacterium]|nr:hypothetical protein [bacterium]